MAGPLTVYVPPYVKRDGTVVQSYQRRNPQTARLPRLAPSNTFRSNTFKRQ